MNQLHYSLSGFVSLSKFGKIFKYVFTLRSFCNRINIYFSIEVKTFYNI